MTTQPSTQADQFVMPTLNVDVVEYWVGQRTAADPRWLTASTAFADEAAAHAFAARLTEGIAIEQDMIAAERSRAISAGVRGDADQSWVRATVERADKEIADLATAEYAVFTRTVTAMRRL